MLVGSRVEDGKGKIGQILKYFETRATRFADE
jgi:hypothetical protein